VTPDTGFNKLQKSEIPRFSFERESKLEPLFQYIDPNVKKFMDDCKTSSNCDFKIECKYIQYKSSNTNRKPCTPKKISLIKSYLKG
jgi:hypothetical protein